jgi:hypothetical protein
MQNKGTGKMQVIKTEDQNQLDAFFGHKKSSEEKKEWIVNLIYTAEEQTTIKKAFNALPRGKKAMRDYQKEIVLAQAKIDIEKGEKLKVMMAEIEK